MTASVVIDRTIAPQVAVFTGVQLPISHGTAAERLAHALRRHIGRGREHSVEAFRLKIGLSSSTVEKMLTAEHTPSLATLLTMKRTLPASFANDLLELARLTGARRLDGTAKAAGVVLAELTHEAAVLAADLADGKLDHVEKAELRKSLPRLIHALQEFQAHLGAE